MFDILVFMTLALFLLYQLYFLVEYAYKKICLVATYLLVSLLQSSAALPTHVAIILDGNRTFARRNRITKKVAYEKARMNLETQLQFLLDIGIKEVTFFMFSKFNFLRPKEEVEFVMNELKVILSSNLQKAKEKKMFRFKAIGNLQLLQEDVAKLCVELMMDTECNESPLVNLAIGYSAREEMLDAASAIIEAISNGELNTKDISDHLYGKCIYTEMNYLKPDILIRTSGQKRLSDFLMWQTSYGCQLYFAPNCWPEFSKFDMVKYLLWYQHNCLNSNWFEEGKLSSKKAQQFLTILYNKRKCMLQNMLNSEYENTQPITNLEEINQAT